MYVLRYGEAFDNRSPDIHAETASQESRSLRLNLIATLLGMQLTGTVVRMWKVEEKREDGQED